MKKGDEERDWGKERETWTIGKEDREKKKHGKPYVRMCSVFNPYVRSPTVHNQPQGYAPIQFSVQSAGWSINTLPFCPFDSINLVQSPLLHVLIVLSADLPLHIPHAMGTLIE